jgi:hypothetical protein
VKQDIVGSISAKVGESISGVSKSTGDLTTGLNVMGNLS